MIYDSDWFLGGSHFPIIFGKDIIMTSFIVTWFFCLLCGTYDSLQSFNAVGCLGQAFTEGLENYNDDVIMTSHHIFGIRNLHIL